MHLLEMAKVAWNALVQSESFIEPGSSREEIERDLHSYLASSEAILLILGLEGDTSNGPLVEIQMLKRMLCTSDPEVRSAESVSSVCKAIQE